LRLYKSDLPGICDPGVCHALYFRLSVLYDNRFFFTLVAMHISVPVVC